MTGRSAAVIDVARAAADDRRRLAQLVPPRTWLLTGLPFAAGALDAEGGPSLLVLLGLVFFTAPFALLRHGLLDIHRPGADPDRPEARTTRMALVVVTLPFLVVLALAGGVAVAVCLLLAVALVVADAAPPMRLRDRPIADQLVTGLLLAIPFAAGRLLGGDPAADLPWGGLLALAAWGVGTGTMLTLAGGAAGTRTAIVEAPTGTVRTLGPVRAAGVALAAYLVAAVAAATLGYLGVLAALGLALFALPAAMILAADRDDAGAAVGDPRPAIDPHEAGAHASPAVIASFAVVAAAARSARTTRLAHAADRAGREIPPLMAVVGAWVLVLVAQQRELTTYEPWTVAIVVPAAFVGYALANIVAIRIAGRRHRVPAVGAADDTTPSLTIVVPTRDAIASLPGCLAAIRAQTYPMTDVLVVDDASTDGTREEAGAWIGDDVVIEAPTRPDGWSSHAWCCRIGAEAASSDLILFVDPDTTLAPIAARVLVEQIMARRDDLLVGLPRSAMPTAGERAGVPGFALVRYGFAPLWWTTLSGGRPAWLTVRDGPLMLVRREAYLAAGGHGPGAGELDRDRSGDLGRAMARAGRRVGVIRLAKLAATRRYLDTAAAVAGWRARIIADGAGRIAGAVLITLVTAIAFLVPLLLPPAAFLAGVEPDLLAASCVPLLLLLVMRVVLAIVDRQPVRTIAWHPVTVLVTLIGQVGGIVDHVLGRDALTLEAHEAMIAGGPPAAGS